MDPRTVARSVALGRVAFGVVMLLVPNTVLARMSAERPGPLVWMARAFGIRDVVLGLGALRSLGDPEPDPAWVRMGALADTSDAVAALAWHRELGASGTAATLSLAVPAAVAGWTAADALG